MQWSVIIICVCVVVVKGGILKDIVNYHPRGFSVSTTVPTITDRKPLHHNEQSYLADDDNPIKATRIQESEVGPGGVSPGPGRPVSYTMKENQQGVYEFNINKNTICKFYTESRQQQRSLQCNERRCQLTNNGTNNWECKYLHCAISESKKEASCKDGGTGKEIFGRGPTIRCPEGQNQADGRCRPNFD